MSRKADLAQALAVRPASLPEVEPELRQVPPRSIATFDRQGAPLHERPLAAIRDFSAVKGWVVSVEEVPDYEGPDFHVRVAWEARGEARVEKLVVGYDTYHWAVGSPEHHEWFFRRIRAGQPVTVLLAPRGKEWRLYGQLEAFVERGGQRVFAAD